MLETLVKNRRASVNCSAVLLYSIGSLEWMLSICFFNDMSMYTMKRFSAVMVYHQPMPRVFHDMFLIFKLLILLLVFKFC